MKIDLNADLGEGFGPWRMGEDEALMSLISSANVACGFHAGDPLIMDNTVRLAKAGGIDLGAHVGFPDLMGFGRRQMNIELKELATYVVYQLGALAVWRRSMPSHDPHEFSRGAGQHGRSRRGAGRTLGLCGGGVRFDADYQLIEQSGHRKRR
nr:LamB/YcsF family protein [Pseudomonas cyclaminis]